MARNELRTPRADPPEPPRSQSNPLQVLFAELKRQQRAAENARFEAICRQTGEAVAPNADFSRYVELLIQAGLIAAGFHQPDYGKWRRRAKR